MKYRALIFLLLISIPPARAADPKLPFDGEWRTSFGTVTLKQSGKDITGTYGANNQFTIKGTVQGNKLTFEYQESQSAGDATWTLEQPPHSFRGAYQLRGGQRGEWNGWRPDPQAAKAKSPNLAGLWLTDLGLMELEQTGDKIKGRYAHRGASDIEGTLTGRKLEFTYKASRNGTGWFDVDAGGTAFNGAATTEGFPNWYGWRGRRAPEFALHSKLIPGKIVDGSTKNLLTYSVRAPQAYKDGDSKKWPTIVILHGSNMSAKAYVNTLASAWLDIARD